MEKARRRHNADADADADADAANFTAVPAIQV
jgi:hypothetical protein